MQTNKELLTTEEQRGGHVHTSLGNMHLEACRLLGCPQTDVWVGYGLGTIYTISKDCCLICTPVEIIIANYMTGEVIFAANTEYDY